MTTETATAAPRWKKALAAGLIGLSGVALVPGLASAHDGMSRAEWQDLSAEERTALREARQAERQANRAERQAEIADLLGISVDEMTAAMQAGSSLADLAVANGVAVEDLVATLVAAKTDHINEHLAAGDITDEQAAERISGLNERITERVNTVPGERGDGDGEGRRGRRGHRGGFGGSAPARADA